MLKAEGKCPHCGLPLTDKVGEKEKHDILYGESLLRLQNPQYVQDLMDAGYEVPEDVLDDLRYVK